MRRKIGHTFGKRNQFKGRKRRAIKARSIGIGTSVFGRSKHDSGFESDTLSGIESSAGSGSAGEVPEGLLGLYDRA